MLKRILTAAVLIPIVVALVLWSPGWLFFLGVLPFALLALWEYAELMARAGTSLGRVALFAAGLAAWVIAAWWPAHLFGSIVIGGLFLLAVACWRRGLVAEIPGAAAGSLMGLFLVALPFALLIELRGWVNGNWLLLYLLALVWVGDTAAYFGGRALGRRRLAPSLSPGKTVEGTLISLVLTVAVGFWLFRTWFSASGAGLPHAVLLPLVVNAAGQLGDLVESGLKRGAGVKDSSGLLPGHGGMLDRVDALLFASPALWYYWQLWLSAGR